MWWSIFVRAEGEVPDGRMTQARLEAFADRLLAFDGVGGGDGAAYDAQLSIQTDTLAQAVSRALAVFGDARDRAGLPAWPYVELETKTEARLEAELARPTFPEVVGVAEAAGLLGLSRQRLFQLMARDDFPPPMVRLAAGPVWLASSIRAFERGWDRRPGRRRKAG